VQIIRKNVKNLTLRITSECEVIVTAPLKMSEESILSFVKSKQKWIDKKLSKCKKVPENKFLYLGKLYNKSELKEDLYQFYYKKAEVLFRELIDKYIVYINKPVTKIRIKKMKTRWGSCNYKKGYINLNIELMKKDIKFIEYVVLHELTHLIHPNHSKEFYNFIENIMPNFREYL
jgi:predicted metal-dependent hydrolase